MDSEHYFTVLIVSVFIAAIGGYILGYLQGESDTENRL